MRTVSRIALSSFIVAACIVALAAMAGDEPGDVQTNREKPTQAAILVTLAPDKTMYASHVKVGAVSNGLPLLCFRDPDKQLVSCFEVNVKTGQVVFIQLPVDETIV